MIIRRWQLRSLVVLIPAILALAAPCVFAQAADDRKEILFLFQSDRSLPSQALLERGLRSTFRDGSPVPIEYYSEYLDEVRTGMYRYEKELVDLLRRKYEGKKLDLIVAVTGPVSKLLVRNQAELFPDTPIVLLALDQRDLADLSLGPNATAVWGEISFRPNLELALQLHPGTREVAVIGGASPWDKYWLDLAREEFRALESSLKFTYLVGLTPAEQKEALAALPRETIVFFVTSVQDRTGNAHENIELLNQISPVSAAPIYGTTETQLGAGPVGGKLLSFEKLGIEGAEVGLRLMAGEKPSDIAPHAVPSVVVFDWRQLQRWGISESALPPDSVVRFRELTLWEQYKWYIVGSLFLLVLQSLLIGFLIYLRYRRREAEAAALRIHGRLREIVANVPGIVWETRTDPKSQTQTTTFISDYVKKMTGFSAEEWLKEPPDFGLRRTIEEDREKVVADTQVVLEKGVEAVSEFRSKTRDGRLQWIENHISPVFDGAEKVVGLRGVALDVTDRKLAEENARRTEEKDLALLSAIPDLMFLQSEDGVYLDYHAKDPAELLVPPESFIGKNMEEVLPTDLAARLADRFARVKDGGKPEILEYTIEKEGAAKWFEARMVRSGTNVLSVVRDISDLKRAQLEAQEISGRLITAQEDERARLARELHDGACQNLALLSIELELITRESDNDRRAFRAGLKTLSERVAELSNELRRMSHQLHPARLSRLGLAPAVRGLCHEIEAAHTVKIEFIEQNVPVILPTLISLNLYRIVQESLQNVVKHSGAVRASVTLSALGDTLHLIISDDGCGFDPGNSAPKGSLGLISIRERVRLLGGEVSIKSGPHGTSVDTVIPIQH